MSTGEVEGVTFVLPATLGLHEPSDSNLVSQRVYPMIRTKKDEDRPTADGDMKAQIGGMEVEARNNPKMSQRCG